MATSLTEKPWVIIAIRLIPLLTALGLVLGFAALCDRVLNAPETVSSADFVNAHTNHANSVIASVQAVEGKKAMLASWDADIGDRVSFQQVLSDAKGSFDAVDNSLVSSEFKRPAGLQSAYDEMDQAVVQLSNAVSSASSFLDSQKSSDLANYCTHWTQGRRQWNTAVTNIWKAAGKPPPRVDDTPAAGCPMTPH